MKHLTIALTIIAFCIQINNTHKLSLDEIRNSVIISEEQQSTGGNIRLSIKELQVNKILMKYKNYDLLTGYNNPEEQASAIHFFKGKEHIEKSKVFKFLKLMPKGGLLHGHNTAMVSSEWVIKNLTYFPDLLKCTNRQGVLILSFRNSSEHDCVTEYVKISDERNRSSNADFYDSILEKSINLYTPRPEVEYPNIKVVWDKFQNMFATVGDLINYLPAFKAYHYRLLEEMYNDGIFYIELRLSFGEGYDVNNRVVSSIEIAETLIGIIEDFKRQHPDFVEAKAIFTTNRKITAQKLLQKINKFLRLQAQFPNFIAGFDLVGQEDLGNSLYFFNQILQTMPKGTRFFFHAGETNWYGAAADLNLLDALLLNTTRIGHGFALIKHPVLWDAVKRRDIAVEINPISNQVLQLVRDLRNHPASFYIAENIPIVIANDDPGFWNAKGVSYDFYYALMSFGSNRSGLRLLKQLIINSIKYTVMSNEERYKAMVVFFRRWDKFLNYILKYGIN